MKKVFMKILAAIAIGYVLVCALLYLFQEHLIFFPERLDKNHRFSFSQAFTEINIPTKDGHRLNGLLFTTDSSKGLIFYLHGNAGSLDGWGDVAKTYTDLGYDVFIPDYRGYGKSSGTISSQQQFYEDVQLAYREMKQRYDERDIVVLGYSIGTGTAARTAASNHPRLLLLQAPYYSLTDMMHHRFPFIPAFILKYTFETNKFMQACTMPVVIFHGDQDEVIYYNSSVKLQQLFKKGDTLITLAGQGHKG